MAKRLSQETKDTILGSNQLKVDFSDVCGIDILSLPKALSTNSKSVTQYDAVVFLVERLGITADEILTEQETAPAIK